MKKNKFLLLLPLCASLLGGCDLSALIGGGGSPQHQTYFIDIKKDDIYLKVGETHYLEVDSYLPREANIRWELYESGIVSFNSGPLEIVGLNAGDVILRATQDNDPHIFDQCMIHIQPVPSSLNIEESLTEYFHQRGYNSFIAPSFSEELTYQVVGCGVYTNSSELEIYQVHFSGYHFLEIDELLLAANFTNVSNITGVTQKSTEYTEYIDRTGLYCAQVYKDLNLYPQYSQLTSIAFFVFKDYAEKIESMSLIEMMVVLKNQYDIHTVDDSEPYSVSMFLYTHVNATLDYLQSLDDIYLEQTDVYPIDYVWNDEYEYLYEDELTFLYSCKNYQNKGNTRVTIFIYPVEDGIYDIIVTISAPN